MQLQPATQRDVFNVQIARAYLQDARDLLRKAKARRACQRVRAALRSCDGALRHVRRRAFRTEQAARQAPQFNGNQPNSNRQSDHSGNFSRAGAAARIGRKPTELAVESGVRA